MISRLMKNFSRIGCLLLVVGSTGCYAQSRYYNDRSYAYDSYTPPSRIQLSYGWAGFNSNFDRGYRGGFGYRGNAYDRGYRDGRWDQRRRYRRNRYRGGRYCPTPNRYRRNRNRW